MLGLANKQPASSRYLDRSATPANFVLVGTVTLLCGLFVAVHTIYLAAIVQSPLLLLDEWRVLPRYIEFMTGKLSLLSFLWEDHFGHRPALARLLFILDAKTVGGTQTLPKTVSVILCGLLAALFAMLLLRQKQIPWGTRLIGVGLLVLVFLPNQQIFNFIIGWNSAILTTVWFSVLALYLLVKSIEKTTSGNRAFVLFVCALLSGILGTYSMANGLLIWPIMFLVCVRFRDWPWAIIVALVGTAVITTYLWDFHRTGQLLDALKQPAELIYFFFTFLGNPTGLSLMPLGLRAPTLFGVLGILLVIYHFFRQGWRTDHDSPTVWFLLGVCFFVIGTAGLTSAGRLTFGAELGVQPLMSSIEALDLRYYTFVSPLWAATLLLGFILLKRNLEIFPRNAWVILDTGALVVSIGMCGSVYITGPSSKWVMRDLHEPFERVTTAIVAGAPDQLALKFPYPYPDIDILLSVPYLASNRLSIFHSNVDYFLYQQAHDALHKPLSDGMLLDGKWCTGWIDDINKVPDVGRTSTTWHQISGWTLDREMERPADGVLFADEEGRLVGIGRMLFARPDVDKALNLKRTQLIVHYNGYVEMGASQSVFGYAFKADRNDLCRFGEKKIRQ
jgi:hypothetical protein